VAALHEVADDADGLVRGDPAGDATSFTTLTLPAAGAADGRGTRPGSRTGADGRIADMCTVVVRVDPGAAWPVTMLALRDESPDRPWDPPAAWWPDRDPEVRGVRDQQAGGAWLAASDRAGLAVVLNRWEATPGVDGTWTTRGTLPLDAVVDDRVPGTDGALPTSRAFNLVRATADGAVVREASGSKAEIAAVVLDLVATALT
jgi:hypothetical protein